MSKPSWDDAPDWSDDAIHHLLVMAYMAGWGDRDQDIVGRNDFRKVAGQRADVAVSDRSSDIYT